jgi:3-hydroxy acid dehydrogenase / malonic semialdehyde reductase
VRFKGDDSRANKVYEGFTPMTPDDVAEIIAFVISRPKHVNIADLIVLAQAQASGSVIYRNHSG